MPARRAQKVLVFGCAALTFTLCAQEGPKAAPAPDGDISELMVLLNTPVISASKREQKAIESPQAIEVITADQIKASGAFLLSDVLRLATGVQVWDADPDRCTVTIRGVNPGGNPRTVQILVDGVAMFNIVAGPVDINGLPVPIDAIERIEIVRGPSSSLYGANAQFGVIAITTKRAKEGVSGSLRAGAAGQGMQREQGYFAYAGPSFSVTAGVGAGSDGNTSVPMNFVGQPGLTVPQNNDSRYLQTFIRPELTLGSSKLWMAYGYGDTGHTDQISYSPANPAALVPLAIFPDLSMTRTLGQVGWSQVWSPTLRSELKVGQKDYQVGMDALAADGANPASAAVVKLLETTDPALATDHAFYHDTVTETSFQLNWDPANNLHVVAGGDSKAIKTDQCLTIGLVGDQSLSASGGFVSVDWTLGPATLSAGARVENEDLGGASTSPRLSVVYQLDDSSVLRAGFFTSTRSPMLQEKDDVINNSPVVTSSAIANPGLQSEKVQDLELGYRKSWARWNLDFTCYHMGLQNLILEKPTGLVIAGKPQEQWQNTPGTFTDSGVELAITGELAPGWFLGGNAATCSFKDPVYGLDQQADYSPANQASLWSRYRAGRFFLFGAVQYVGSYTVSDPLGAAVLRQTIAAATHLSFNIGYEFLKGLSVSAYGIDATHPTSETTNNALLNTMGIRYQRRELGLQAAYRF